MLLSMKQPFLLVPFILVDGGKWPKSDYLEVNLDGSKHPLPLTTHPLPLTIVGLLDEEKSLPVGKEITAVGLVSLKNGIPEVMSCKDLPFFLSNMSKDQMVLELDFRTKKLLRSGIVIGLVATGILRYVVIRNWNK